MGSYSSRIDPLAVLLLRRGTVSVRSLGALRDDPRVELFVIRRLTPDRVVFAQRVAAVVVATTGDPLAALTYVVTAGVAAPIVVALAAKHKRDSRDVLAAGAAACLTLPLTPADVNQLVRKLRRRRPAAHIDANLRLLLDPIGRVARYHDRSIQLSQREFALLHRLSNGRGRPVAADDLLKYVWGEKKAAEQSRQILEVYIFQLRRKLEGLGLNDPITTVRRFGYVLGQPADRSN